MREALVARPELSAVGHAARGVAAMPRGQVLSRQKIRAGIEGEARVPDDTIVAVNAGKKLRTVLDSMSNLQLAVLFGSAANGTARTESDLDVGVLLEPGADRSPLLAVVLERAAGQRVDMVWLDEAPPLLRFEIARTGRVLVERVPHSWTDFRAHAMIDWWDWAPTARIMHAAMTARLREEAQRGPS